MAIRADVANDRLAARRPRASFSFSAFLFYFAVHFAPGDPLSRYYSPEIDPASMERVRSQLGLDRPAYVQYGKWLWSFARGDFGVSLTEHRPVSAMLGEAIPRTLRLTVLAFLVQLVFGVGLGMFAAAKRHKVFGKLLSVSALVIYALPAFYLAYLLIAIFSLHLNLLPTSGMETIDPANTSSWALFRDHLAHLVLPVVVLGVASAAGLIRYTRGSVLDVIGEDFIRTARAKGLGEGRVVWWHAFRNALPPILTVVGLSVPFLLGGAVIVETVFAWPGVGKWIFDGVVKRDYMVIQGGTLMVAVSFVLVNLVVDGQCS